MLNRPSFEPAKDERSIDATQAQVQQNIKKLQITLEPFVID